MTRYVIKHIKLNAYKTQLNNLYLTTKIYTDYE